jgi:hypothetical protein
VFRAEQPIQVKAPELIVDRDDTFVGGPAGALYFLFSALVQIFGVSW